MADQTITFTTLGYRNLDALGDVLGADDLAGLRRSILPRDVNLYAILGDGDAALEAGESATKLGDMTLLGDVNNVAASVTAADPVIVTAHGRLNGETIGTLTEALTFRFDAFGLDNGPDGLVGAGYLNDGDSLSYVTRDPLATFAFTVETPLEIGTARILLDVDGDVMRTAGGSTGGTATRAQEQAHFLLALDGLKSGDRVEIDVAAGAILVNGAAAGPGVASAAGIAAFFAAFAASDGHRLTIGSNGGAPVALGDVKIGLETEPANTPVGPVDDIDTAPDTLAEDATTGAAVGITLSATDADPEDTVSFALDDGRFAVDEGGVVRVAAGASFDFETEPEITMVATATSSDGSTSTQSFTIVVGNVNEAAVGPVSDTDNAPNTILEDAAPGAAVGITLSATDADPEDRVSFALDDGRFTVDADGVVRVAAGASFDFETEPEIALVATAISSDGSTSTQSFTIEIGDIAENAAPIARADRIVTNLALGTAIVLPEWVFLANDSDIDSPTLQISGVHDATGGTLDAFVSTAANDDAVVFTDLSPAGGSFAYDISDGSQMATATVAVTMTTFDNISGTGADEIIVGNAGNNQLYAGAGVDHLFGGAALTAWCSRTSRSGTWPTAARTRTSSLSTSASTRAMTASRWRTSSAQASRMSRGSPSSAAAAMTISPAARVLTKSRATTATTR